MKSVFILWHTHNISENEEDSKLLGVYSSHEIAKNKIQSKFKQLPGFNQKSGKFIIDEYIMDKDYWDKGFTF